MRSSTLLLFAWASSSESLGRGFSLSIPGDSASLVPQASDADAGKPERVRQKRAEDPAGDGCGDDEGDDLEARAHRIASGEPPLRDTEGEHDDDRKHERCHERDGDRQEEK